MRRNTSVVTGVSPLMAAAGGTPAVGSPLNTAAVDGAATAGAARVVTATVSVE